jgi:hypothetical protein
MMEPFFGSTPALWGAIASPGFGWSQTTIPGGHGPGAAATMSSAAQTRLPAEGIEYGGASPLTVPGALGIAGIVPVVATAAPTAGAVVAAVALRRGQSSGPTSDAELEDFLYDAFELLPGTTDVEVRCEGGRATLAGSVPHKRLKRDIGEIAWAIPLVTDVQNSVTIATRRRARASSRETEAQQGTPVRKHA